MQLGGAGVGAGRVMLAYSIRRFGLAILVAVAVSALTFLLLRTSGDPAVALAGEGAHPEDIERIRHLHGLGRPLLVQYFDWLAHILHGDFGRSLHFKTDVAGLVSQKLPTTALLAFLSLAFAIAVSLPLGILAAVFANRWIDRLCLGIAAIGQALPNFFLAMVLMVTFAVWLRVLPASGSTTWAHFILPAVALGCYITPPLLRLVRAGMIDALASDYVRTARANGLPARRIVFKYALRNALIPVVALAAVQLGFLLGGSVAIETVFALDGVGYLAYQSITHNDMPVIQAIVTLLALIYVGLTLFADLTNAWLDPRIRLG